MATAPTFPALSRCAEDSAPIRVQPQPTSPVLGSVTKVTIIRAQGWWVDGPKGLVWLQIHGTHGTIRLLPCLFSRMALSLVLLLIFFSRPVWTCVSHALSS